MLSEAETVYDGCPDVRWCDVSSCSSPASSKFSDAGSAFLCKDEDLRSPHISSRPPSFSFSAAQDRDPSRYSEVAPPIILQAQSRLAPDELAANPHQLKELDN